MRPIFLKLSATALTGLALVLGSLSASLAAQSTPAATTAATASSASNATAQPAAPTSLATSGAAQYPPCPNPNATAVATTVSTVAAATPAATAPVNPNPGYLGVAAQQIQNCGAQILDVRPDSAAAGAKLQIGDVVVAVNGQPINGVDQFREIVQSHKPGDKITITYQRSGQQADTTATLQAVPPETTVTQAATAGS